MAHEHTIDPRRTALLVMDVQYSVLKRYKEQSESYLARLATVVNAARAAQVKVIYVIVGFRAGYPEVSPRNAMFGPLKAAGGSMFVDDKVHETVAPRGEAVVVKRRVSAFAGSDLETVLRAEEIEHLILTGVATSGVVLSTVRQAADADYKLTVVKDCCLDTDEQVHDVLMSKVFPRQANVVTSTELTAALADHPAA